MRNGYQNHGPASGAVLRKAGKIYRLLPVVLRMLPSACQRFFDPSTLHGCVHGGRGNQEQSGDVAAKPMLVLPYGIATDGSRAVAYRE